MANLIARLIFICVRERAGRECLWKGKLEVAWSLQRNYVVFEGLSRGKSPIDTWNLLIDSSQALEVEVVP
jgi:hypothetical protein